MILKNESKDYAMVVVLYGSKHMTFTLCPEDGSVATMEEMTRGELWTRLGERVRWEFSRMEQEDESDNR